MAFPEGLQREAMAETNTGKVLVAEQDRHPPPRAAPIKDHFCIRDTANERVRLHWRQRRPRLRTAANRLNGRPVKSRPAPMVKDLAGFRVCALCQHTRSAGVCRPPPVTESGFDSRTLMLKLWVTGGSPARRPGDPAAVFARVAVHHLAQRARLNSLYEPDGRRTAPTGSLWLKPVTELDLREARAREQNRHPPPGATAHNDHFGVRGGAQEVIMRERIPGLRAVPYRLDGHRSNPGLTWLGDESSGFGVITFGQQLWLTAGERNPSLAEGGLDLSTLPLKFRITVRARHHDRIVAEL